MKNFVDILSDDEFIAAVNKSSSYILFCRNVGYVSYPTKNIHNKIKNRANKLNVSISHFKNKRIIRTDVEFIDACKKSKSFNDLRRELYGLDVKTGGNSVFKKRIDKLSIDISHFVNNLEQINYSDEQLIDVVNNSTKFSEVGKKLGYKTFGEGSRVKLIKRAKLIGLDISNLKLRQTKRFFPISDYLNNKRFIGSSQLKNRLIDEKIFEAECSSCKKATWSCELTNWEEKPINLTLDHISGDSRDNSLENLRLLCCLCHSYTNTYAGKNISYKERERLNKI